MSWSAGPPIGLAPGDPVFRQPGRKNTLTGLRIVDDHVGAGGGGQALFAQLAESRHLNLVEATPFPSGIIVHIYQPQHT